MRGGGQCEATGLYMGVHKYCGERALQLPLKAIPGKLTKQAPLSVHLKCGEALTHAATCPKLDRQQVTVLGFKRRISNCKNSPP